MDDPSVILRPIGYHRIANSATKIGSATPADRRWAPPTAAWVSPHPGMSARPSRSSSANLLARRRTARKGHHRRSLNGGVGRHPIGHRHRATARVHGSPRWRSGEVLHRRAAPGRGFHPPAAALCNEDSYLQRQIFSSASRPWKGPPFVGSPDLRRRSSPPGIDSSTAARAAPAAGGAPGAGSTSSSTARNPMRSSGSRPPKMLRQRRHRLITAVRVRLEESRDPRFGA